MLKLPAWTFLKAETSAADAIGEQLGHLDRAHAAADAEMSRLAAARPALLLDTTATADAKLEKHDAEQAAARRVMEATAARRAALEVEWREAEAREAFAKDQAERLALYKEALAAAKERESICAEYEIAAAKVADLFKRLKVLFTTVNNSNDNLPEGKDQIPRRSDKYAYCSELSGKVSLPSPRPNTSYYWSGHWARAPSLSAEQDFALK